MAKIPQCTKVAMTFKKETAYGTAVANASIDKLYEPLEPILIEPVQNRTDDSDFIKGHEFPLNPDLDIIVAQDISVPINFPCGTSLLGLLMAYVMGSNYAVAGTTPNFVHTYKVQDLCASDQMPSTTWFLGFIGDTASFYRVKGLIVNELVITMNDAGHLTLTGTAFTDGILAADATFTFPTTFISDDILLGNTSDFLTANSGGSLVSKATKFRKFTLTINAGLDLADGRSNTATAGAYLSSLRTAKRSIGLEVVVEGHQGDEFWADFEAKTMKDVKITVTKNANRYFEARIKNCKIGAIRQGFDGIRDTLTLTYKPFWTTADASPIILTVGNGDAAYQT